MTNWLRRENRVALMLLWAAAVGLTAWPAWAGCANYTDGSLPDPAPAVTICLNGACEETTLDYVCENAHFSSRGYANGWVASEDFDSDKIAIQRPVVVPPADYPKISCKSADDEACFTHLLDQ